MKKSVVKNEKSVLACCFSLNNKMYIFAVFLIIVALAIWISGCNKKVVKQGNSAEEAAKDFNVQINIPQENIGDINKVPKEKVDSLFSNLKK